MSTLMHSSSNSASSPKPSSRVGHSLYSRSFYQKQKGFTLLELVLVMLIIGLVASTPLAFIDNQDNQFRYDETLDKMVLIERAVFNQSLHRNQPILSGFVVDNGVLPPTSGTASQTASELFPLIAKVDINGDPTAVSGWEDKGMISPYVFSGTASQAEISGYPQLKGYRGHYLSSGLDSNQEFLDGWGKGFLVSASGAEYQFNYKGDDGEHPSQYGTVVSGAVSSNDWQVPLNQIDIELINNSALDGHVLALVVFKNEATSDPEDRWTTYHFYTSASSAEHSISFTSSQWERNGTAGIDTALELIPAGQHPVFVLDSTGTPEKYDRLLVVPRSTQPALQFEVN